MLDVIKDIDTQLLLFFNQLNNEFLDFIFFWISDKWIWIPFYAWLAWLLFKKFQIDFIWMIIFIAAAITASDQIASNIIKDSVMRLRPCHEPSIMSQIHLVNGHCGGKYGFISSHAANSFTLAVFLITMLRPSGKFKIIFWSWAFLVAFSRIYLGVHYPADVIGGALLGISSGLLFAYLCRSTIEKYSFAKKNK